MIKQCKICNSEFKSKNGSRDKTCSQICSNQAKSNSKIRYTPEQINQVVELRKNGMPRAQIASQLNISLAKIKRIIADHDLNVSKETAQANARTGQIEKFGSIEAWSRHCRNGLTQEIIKRRNEISTINNKARAINDGMTASIRHYYRHHEEMKAYGRKWAKDNKEYRAYMTACRRAYKLQRTPNWLTEEDHKAIENMYLNRPQGFHVDHIVPLKGKNVSGLHVPWNLQYLPALDNLKKKNKF